MMSEKIVYSVQQINLEIKSILEGERCLKNIRVQGEISNCRYTRPGHIYFSLKDESGVIPAVIFSSKASRLKFRLSDGLKVDVDGSVEVYLKDGKYQLVATSISDAGEGNLYKKFEELKARLEEMGMFAAEYKKPIPKFSYRIGVVTSKTGAVIRDIYNVSKRRNPYTQITLFPATVQGDLAPASVIAGIKALDPLNLDVIIVGRGGGSIEDLWAFNDENLARAIFDCNTPVISAVGHETDFTIADFVADLRAPTPSAAAELAVFDYSSFMNFVSDLRNSLRREVNRAVSGYKDKALNYKKTITLLSPKNKLNQKIMYLQSLSDFLDKSMDDGLNKAKHELTILAERLRGLSPLKRLSEGYSFVADKGGRTVKSISQVKIADILDINVSDGTISAEVKNIRGEKYE